MEEETKVLTKVGFVIGHYLGSRGAMSDYFNQKEYFFWKDYAYRQLSNMGTLYLHSNNSSYSGRQSEMAERTKDLDLVFELHFNSFNSAAGGSEVVIYKGNKVTKELGELFISDMNSTMGYDKRSVKEVNSDSDRGYGFLQKTRGSAIILEPFFGDNESDCKKFVPWKYKDVIQSMIEKYKTI